MAVSALKRWRTNDLRGERVGNDNITRITRAHVFIMYLVGGD